MVKYKVSLNNKRKEGKLMTIIEAIQKGVDILNKEKIDSPKLKARILIEYLLNKSRQYIVANDSEEIDEKIEKKYFEAIEKIKNGNPIEHITNKKEFMKLEFFVDENVLIPRADTEILVEEVISIANKTNSKKILDLCTGSGAIAISLAKYIPESKITAIDISSKAIEIAKSNAIRNNVEDKIKFIESDLFEKIIDQKFDIIVSNPPYIKTKEINELDKQVKKEPYIALDGGNDGLDFYKKIINKGKSYLIENGYICLEIGYDQKEKVIELIEKEEKFIETYSKKDLYDNDRIVITKLK